MYSASSFTPQETHRVFVQNCQLYLHDVGHYGNILGHRGLENTIAVVVCTNMVLPDLTDTTVSFGPQMLLAKWLKWFGPKLAGSEEGEKHSVCLKCPECAHVSVSKI